MKCVLAALTLTVLVALTTGEKKLCACRYIYSPVCATDKTMFPNLCDLQCDGEKELAPDMIYNRETGKCKKLCVCTDDWTPVCATDNTMFSNLCSLNCDGDKIFDGNKVFNEETQQCEDI